MLEGKAKIHIDGHIWVKIFYNFSKTNQISKKNYQELKY